MINTTTAAKIKPGRSATAINLGSGNVNLPVPCRSFFVGVGGNVVVILADDTTSVVLASGSSQYHPLEVKSFIASGTTASGIIAIY